MNKLIFTALLIFSVSSYADSQEYKKCITEDVPMAVCSGDEYDRQDKRLNTAYKALIKSMPELKQQQRTWIKKRDSSCPETDEDTAHSYDMRMQCLFRITESRASELEKLKN